MAKVGKRKSKENSFLIDDCRCTARITKSELKSGKENKKVKGIMITFKLRDGKQKGKELSKWYTIEHPTSSQAEMIGLESLDHIGFCCGLDKYKDTKEFHGVDVTVDITKDGKFNSVEVFPLEKSGKKKKKKKKKGKKDPF